MIEVVGGWLANSLALLADAGHMLTDVAALALSLFVAWFSRQPASPQRTYGYLRWEVLAAFLNGAINFMHNGLTVNGVPSEALPLLQPSPQSLD